MDGIIVHASNQKEHDKCLENSVRVLRDKGITLNRRKCQLNMSQVVFIIIISKCPWHAPDNNTIERLIGSYTSPYWRSGISSTSVKKSQIFNKDECKYLFLPFQLKSKPCRFHSFIRMSMSCLLHKLLQSHVQCNKYTLFKTALNLLGEIS